MLQVKEKRRVSRADWEGRVWRPVFFAEVVNFFETSPPR